MLNSLFNNDLVFYSLFAGTVGFIGYKFASSIWNNSENNSDFDYLNTDLDTSSNVYSDLGIQTIPNSVSTGATVLPTPPVNIEIVPNPDLVEYALSHKSLVKSKIQEINGLYGKEMFDYTITNADLTYIVNSYSITQLNSSGINEAILNIMSCFNG